MHTTTAQPAPRNIRIVQLVSACAVLIATLSSVVAVEIGEPAPDFSTVTWLREYEPDAEQVYVVDIFAAWIPTMDETVPALMELHTEYGERIDVVGLSTDTIADLKDFRQRIGPALGYPIGNIPTEVLELWKDEEQTLPFTMVIDAAGVVQWHGHPLDAQAALLVLFESDQ